MAKKLPKFKTKKNYYKRTKQKSTKQKRTKQKSTRTKRKYHRKTRVKRRMRGGWTQHAAPLAQATRDATQQAKIFTMNFPPRENKVAHNKIFSNMLQPESSIARNQFTLDIGFISTIVIDGDFAKNDCDDIWALAYITKNIAKINGEGNPAPRIICGSLDGGIDIRQIGHQDLTIDWSGYRWAPESGSVQHRDLTGLTGSVLIYILGGVNPTELQSYQHMIAKNPTANLCFIFQSPAQWTGSPPSNVRSGYPFNARIPQASSENTNANASVAVFYELINTVKHAPNTRLVFTEFDRLKRYYNIKYLPDGSITPETPVAGKDGLNGDEHTILGNYLTTINPIYKPYHINLQSYNGAAPNRPAFNVAKSVDQNGKPGILIKYGTFLADLYTVYASLTHDANIEYAPISDIAITE